MQPIRPFSESPAQDEEFKGKALIFRAQRQALLASNIANADTPGYKALDASFTDSLKREIAGKGWSETPAASSDTDAPVFQVPYRSTLDFARYVQPLQRNLDQNTVDMDRERVEFTRNTILYQMALTSFEDELKEFKLASSNPLR